MYIHFCLYCSIAQSNLNNQGSCIKPVILVFESCLHLSSYLMDPKLLVNALLSSLSSDSASYLHSINMGCLMPCRFTAIQWISVIIIFLERFTFLVQEAVNEKLKFLSFSQVMAVKKTIEDSQGKCSYPWGQQLLIHNGKVLKDESTLEENKVSEDGFLVVMLSKVHLSFLLTLLMWSRSLL